MLIVYDKEAAYERYKKALEAYEKEKTAKTLEELKTAICFCHSLQVKI